MQVLKKISYLPYLLAILLMLGFLRFEKLDYSDYTTDETSVMGPIRDGVNIFSPDFLLNQYKGPMQFVVAKPLAFFGVSPFNEFAYRSIYAAAGTLAFGVMFLYIREVTKNNLASFLAVMFIGVNGFLVGLTRIVQYQSLNLLFSAMALLFFHKYYEKRKLKMALLGSVLLALSILSHWDAILVGPIILFYVLSAPNKKLNVNFKHLASIFGLGLLLLLPFLVPYIHGTISNPNAIDYLNSRLGSPTNTFEERLEYYDFFARLYNPFLFVEVFLVISCLFILLAKKHFPYVAWYSLLLIVFLFLVQRSGTHMYNVLIPFAVLLGLLFKEYFNLLVPYLKVFSAIAFLVLVYFLGHQSYLLFIDTAVEYPWKVETIYSKYETKEYTAKELANNLVGFPHNRYWKEARQQLEEKYPDYKQFTYVTNDRNDAPGYYLDLEPGKSEKTFIFGIKEPTNFATDTRFSQIENKKEILKLKNKSGRTVNTVKVSYTED